MQPTRTVKNLALCAANLVLLLVIVPKFVLNPASVGDGMRVWMFSVPVVVAAVLATPVGFQYAKGIHALLFLTTGAAIGMTLGALIRDAHSVTNVEVLWLPVGIAAAVFHYWPSTNDQYR